MEIEEEILKKFVAPPKRLEPSFIQVEAKINEPLLNKALSDIEKAPLTKSGALLYPKELDTVIDVALSFDRENKVQKLLEQYHPTCPYGAYKSSAPYVKEVGETAVLLRNPEWYVYVGAAHVKVGKFEPGLYSRICLARTGYAVWEDGFAQRGEPAVEVRVFHEDDYNSLIEAVQAGVKLFGNIYPKNESRIAIPAMGKCRLCGQVLPADSQRQHLRRDHGIWYYMVDYFEDCSNQPLMSP